MKVVKVKFKENEEEHFFTSYAAIYEHFSREKIGAVLGSVWNKVKSNGKYENGKVCITCHPIYSKRRISN